MDRLLILLLTFIALVSLFHLFFQNSIFNSDNLKQPLSEEEEQEKSAEENSLQYSHSHINLNNYEPVGLSTTTTLYPSLLINDETDENVPMENTDNTTLPLSVLEEDTTDTQILEDVVAGQEDITEEEPTEEEANEEEEDIEENVFSVEPKINELPTTLAPQKRNNEQNTRPELSLELNLMKRQKKTDINPLMLSGLKKIDLTPQKLNINVPQKRARREYFNSQNANNLFHSMNEFRL